MAYTDDWESLMNGVFGPGGRFKAAPGTSAPKTGGSAALPDLNAALLEQQKRLDELLKQQNAQLRTQSRRRAGKQPPDAAGHGGRRPAGQGHHRREAGAPGQL